MKVLEQIKRCGVMTGHVRLMLEHALSDLRLKHRHTREGSCEDYAERTAAASPCLY